MDGADMSGDSNGIFYAANRHYRFCQSSRSASDWFEGGDGWLTYVPMPYGTA